MSSGVQISSECVPVFNDSLKLGKSIRAIFYKLDQKSEKITVEKTIPRQETNFETIVGELPLQEPRYVTIDYEYKSEDNVTKSKIIFLSWCPNGTPIRARMLHTSSLQSIRRALVGINFEIQASDFSECSHEVFLERINRI
ncbi:hypothetical protein CYY_009187 [Polysphondylium violaceum]|uniref:ADF-H domain-containing protein n=1 Tax=Polysphondylium violaceum TaxID=133409 RepID=A0A8J4PM45_9MYCE|nr:hypothetical protein CYY_009187 [Polysphondylium violaceum]